MEENPMVFRREAEIRMFGFGCSFVSSNIQEAEKREGSTCPGTNRSQALSFPEQNDPHSLLPMPASHVISM